MAHASEACVFTISPLGQKRKNKYRQKTNFKTIFSYFPEYIIETRSSRKPPPKEVKRDFFKAGAFYSGELGFDHVGEREIPFLEKYSCQCFI